MARRWREPVAGLLALGAVTAAPAIAQLPILDFRTPDGSRCVLVVDTAIPHVHWVVATWADAAEDPVGSEGLAFATVVASLHGTWRTGSLDPDRERAALDALDQALADPAGDSSPAAAAVLRDRRREAEALADLSMFPRVLAAAPAFRPEVIDLEPLAALALTTVDTAIAEVARLLVERREQQALRRLPEAWQERARTLADRHQAQPANLPRAEILALTMPGHPAIRPLESPPRAAPRRSQALAVWAATQRPERTVHVLLGRFDATAARAALDAAFATTDLPAFQPPPRVAPRALPGVRRSVIAGARQPMVGLAWVLPAGTEPHLLAVATQWLAGGGDSFVAQRLRRAGRATASVRSVAPWPPSIDDAGLLLLEAADTSTIDGLADQLLAACQQAASTLPEATALRTVALELDHEARLRTDDDRARACRLALQAMLRPRAPLNEEQPPLPGPEAVQLLLQRILGAQPAIVEARP